MIRGGLAQGQAEKFFKRQAIIHPVKLFED